MIIKFLPLNTILLLALCTTSLAHDGNSGPGSLNSGRGSMNSGQGSMHTGKSHQTHRHHQNEIRHRGQDNDRQLIREDDRREDRREHRREDRRTNR